MSATDVDRTAPSIGEITKWDPGLTASGDQGRFDSAGRLFVVDRDGEMFVSGGGNTYPVEVENTLMAHPDDLDWYVRDELAAYEVPREVSVLHELRRNDTGKVLRRELQARAGNG